MGTLSDPLRAAQALRATIRATRQETEEARCLAPLVVEGLIDAGLCRLAVPASLGGHEAEPVVALQVYEELAWADASVAWIAWNNQLVGLASRYSSEAVRTEIFRDRRRLFATSTRPSGSAVVAEGGFRVSGRWSLVSGCELAEWIPVMCVITEGTASRQLAPGVPEMRMADLPKARSASWTPGMSAGCGAPAATISW
jgi:alkylation response protein AidB-like acyl-CoA dehydrogenase